eukprot:gene13143-13273_t
MVAILVLADLDGVIGNQRGDMSEHLDQNLSAVRKLMAAPPGARGAKAPAPAARSPAAASSPAVKVSSTVKQTPAYCHSQGFKPANGSLLYLYVWAGVENAVGASAAASTPGGNTAKDFVATLDVTNGSPCFGKVVSAADVPTSGNEPHHVGLSINGTVLGVGGFNSWRYKQPSVYFFDVASNPAAPKYIKSITPELGTTTDDLIRLPNGGFLVSLMGNSTEVSVDGCVRVTVAGGTPGRVAEIDANLNLVAEHPRSNSNIEHFNPHGLSLTPGPLNRMVTLDYVEYGSTFKPASEVKYRTTARIWDQKKREIIKVLDLGPQAKGLMTASFLPNGKAQFLITAGHGVLYLLDADQQVAKPVFDFKAGDGHCVLMLPFKNGTRVIASIYTKDEVQLLDISNTSNVKLLQTMALPKKAGPHATVLAPGDKLLAISTYYVQHDHGLGFAAPFTDVGEKGVRLYSVAADGNSITSHPKVPYIDFKNLFPHKGTARPHGMAFKAVPVK